MNPAKSTGLGEPEPSGKKALFQPPKEMQGLPQEAAPQSKLTAHERVRTTLSLTKHALGILQEHQHRYRLDTGRALPKWKIIGEALELFENARKGDGNEKSA